MALSQTREFATGPNTEDGELLGRSATAKVGFYGTVPIVQPVLAGGATTAQIVAALTALGLVKPS